VGRHVSRTIAANLRPTLPGCASAMARDPHSGMICTMEPTIATRGRFTIPCDQTNGRVSTARAIHGYTQADAWPVLPRARIGVTCAAVEVMLNQLLISYGMVDWGRRERSRRLFSFAAPDCLVLHLRESSFVVLISSISARCDAGPPHLTRGAFADLA
jgi:hypothetical protein